MNVTIPADFFENNPLDLSVVEKFTLLEKGHGYNMASHLVNCGWRLISEISVWMEANIHGNFKVMRNSKTRYTKAFLYINFENEADAILFKMRWL